MTVRVINLDRHVERLRTFLTTNAHVPDIVRASGVDGKSADREALRELGVISADLKYSDHNLGCALAHVTIRDGRVAIPSSPRVWIDGLFDFTRRSQGSAGHLSAAD